MQIQNFKKKGGGHKVPFLIISKKSIFIQTTSHLFHDIIMNIVFCK